jgi:uncharacterized protein (TIGR03067 family)
MKCLAVLVFILAFTGAGFWNVTAQEPTPELQGVWHGVKADTKTIKGILKGDWTFKDGVISILEHGKSRNQYTYTIDAKKNPKEIDLVYTKEEAPKGFAGQKIKGIYRIEKDTLIICHVNADSATENEKADRPSSFDTTKRDDVVLLTLKRKK